MVRVTFGVGIAVGVAVAGAWGGGVFICGVSFGNALRPTYDGACDALECAPDAGTGSEGATGVFAGEGE